VSSGTLARVMSAGALLLLAFLLITPPQSPDRSVAVFQNVATAFWVICLLRVPRSHFNNPDRSKASLRALSIPLSAGVVVWAASLSAYFVSDDFGHLRAMSRPLQDIIRENFVFGQAHTFLRPLGFITLALDYRLFHLWAPGFHIVCLPSLLRCRILLLMPRTTASR